MKVKAFELTVLAAALMAVTGQVAAYQSNTSFFLPTLYQTGSLQGQPTQFLKQGTTTRWTDSPIKSAIYDYNYGYNYGNTQQTANYDRNLQENIEVSRQLANSYSNSNVSNYLITYIDPKTNTSGSGSLTLGDVDRKIDGSLITANDVREWTVIDSNGVPTKKYYVVLGADRNSNEIREEVGYNPPQTQTGQQANTARYLSISEYSNSGQETVYPEGGAVLYTSTYNGSSNNSTTIGNSAITEHNNNTNSNSTTLYTSNNTNGLDYQRISSNSSDILTAYERDPYWSYIVVNGQPVIKQIQQSNSTQTNTLNLYQAGQPKVREEINQSTTSSSTTDASGQVLASSSGHNNSSDVTYAKGQVLDNSTTRDAASTSTRKNVTVSVDSGMSGYWFAPSGWYYPIQNNAPAVLMTDITSNSQNTSNTDVYQAGADKVSTSSSVDSQHTTGTYADGKTALNNRDSQSSQTTYNEGRNSKYSESTNTVTTEIAHKTYQKNEDGAYVVQNGQPVESGYVSSNITVSTSNNQYQLGQERKQDTTKTVNSTESVTNSMKGTSWQGQGQSTLSDISYRKNQADGKATETTYAGQYTEKNSSAAQVQNRAESANSSSITYNAQSNLISADKDSYTDARKVTQNGQVTSDYRFSANSSQTQYRNDAGYKNEVNGTASDTRSLLATNELDYESATNTQENLTSTNSTGQQTSASLARNNSIKQYADGRTAVSNGGKLVRTDATGAGVQVEDNVVTNTNQFGNQDSTTQIHTITNTQAGSTVASQTQTRTDSVAGIQLTAQSNGSVVTKAASIPTQSTSITAAGITTTGTVSATGLNLNGGSIQNVQAGSADTDATNVKQLRDGNAATLAAANAYSASRSDQLAHRLNNVEKAAYSGVAISLAAQQSVPNLKPGNVAVYGGMGQYKSASAGAVGITSLMQDGRTSISAAFGFADSDVGGRVGVSYVFGD